VGRAGRDRWDVKGEVDLDPELGDDEDNVGSNDEVAHELDDDEDDGDEDDLDTDESADDVSEPASSSDEEQVQQRGV
jgi:hypothetical protein